MAVAPRPPLLQRRRTKIVATLGPASASPDRLRALVAAGVDVFRLNFSHGTAQEHAEVAGHVRRATDGGDGREVALLADLCGPKLRVGELPDEGLELVAGARAILDLGPDCDERAGIRPDGTAVIPAPHPELLRDLAVGHRVLFADGAIELRIEREGAAHGDARAASLSCGVVRGGVLHTRKGINLPDSRLSLPALTDKDLDDLAAIAGIGVDWIALSFVRRASDVDALRARLEELLPGGARAPRILAKIERPEALDDIDAILATADAIMVARGDLGVELPAERVPHLQDELVRRARAAKRPVVIATEMLDSMIERSRPTRAEASDVAHAVLSGADAVMLSGETAVGRFPIETVTVMDHIVREAEARLWHEGAFAGLDLRAHADARTPPALDDAVADAVTQLSRSLRVRAVLVVSDSGTSALTVAAARPAAPMIAAVPDVETARMLSLAWGLVPRVVASARLGDAEALAESLARGLGLADDGQRVLAVGGFRVPAEESTPAIRVVHLASRHPGPTNRRPV